MVRTAFAATLWRRVATLVFASVMAWSTMPATALAAVTAAMAPDQKEIERIYLEGQSRLEDNDFKAAADSFTNLLNLVPESGDTQALRETFILNAMEARLRAYRQGAGEKEIEQLHKGKESLDQYYADFKSTHGDRTAVSQAVTKKAAELEEELERAAPKATPPVPKEPELTPDKDPRVPAKAIIYGPQRDGTGFLIGGGVVAALGIGALVMIPVGSLRGKSASEEYQAADARRAAATDSSDPTGNTAVSGMEVEYASADTAVQKADFKGKQADQILIAGAILTPLLFGGAAALIYLGLRDRKKAKKARERADQRASQARVDAIAPMFGRGSAGFALTGRF